MTFLLFPGQGSQKSGMGRDLYDASKVARDTLDSAAAILGPDFLPVMFDGPDDRLKDTRNAQVALVAVGVAIARHLHGAGMSISGAAGHSVGEIAALVAVESLGFDDAIRLTRERARLMAEKAPPGGMAAVLGLEPDAIEACLTGEVEVANFNGPAQTIISGSVAAIDAVTPKLKEAGAKRVMPLPVSGAFHSSFMKEPARLLREFLQSVSISAPNARFVSSVSAREESEPGRIRELLSQQLYSPVRWTETMQAVGAVDAIEAGPGNVLQGIAKRIDNAPRIRPAGTLADVSALSLRG